MKNTNAAILVVTICLFFTGCASSRTVNVRLADPSRLGVIASGHGRLPASSPENCHNALLRSWQSDSDHGLQESIKYANQMFAQWPYHNHLSSSAYLAGWSALFLESGRITGNINELEELDEYLTALLVASNFFISSARSDKSSGGFWTQACGQPLNMIHEGYYNREAVDLYLKAKRLTKIRYLNTGDEMDLVRAIAILSRIEEEHPEWARFFGVAMEKKETLTALTIRKSRDNEADSIFGN